MLRDSLCKLPFMIVLPPASLVRRQWAGMHGRRCAARGAAALALRPEELGGRGATVVVDGHGGGTCHSCAVLRGVPISLCPARTRRPPLDAPALCGAARQ